MNLKSLLLAFGCLFWVAGFHLQLQAQSCGSPLTITPGTQITGANTAGAGSNWNVTPCSNDNAASYISDEPDEENHIYSYTPASNEAFTVTLSNTSDSWTGVHVTDGCNDAGANCIGFQTIRNGDPAIVTGAFNAGTTYYIAVSTWPTPDNVVYDLLLETAACNPAAGAASVGTCDAGNMNYMIDVDITDLGDGTVNITNNAGVPPTNGVSTTGVTSVGPFPFNTDVIITLEHPSVALCNVSLATINIDGCPPGNDKFCNATPLTVAAMGSGANCAGTFPYDNTNAGEEANEPLGDCFSGTPDNTVWFSFVGPASGVVDVTTDFDGGTSEDTEVAVYSYSGPACPSADLSMLTQIGCDQDGGEAENFNSTIACLPVNTGETYYVQVSGWNGTQGTFCLEVTEGPIPPSNDRCTGAAPISESSGSGCDNAVAGTTLNATSSPLGFGLKEVWYDFTATNTELIVEVNNITATAAGGTPTQSAVGVYTGTCAGGLTLVAGGFAPLAFEAMAGSQYYIAVDTRNDSNDNTPADFDVCIYNCPKPANDACMDALALTESTDENCNNQVTGTTVCATPTADNTASSGGEVWYAMTATTDAPIHVFESVNTSDGSPSVIGVYSGACGSLTLEGSGLSPVSVTLTQGTQYYVMVTTLDPGTFATQDGFTLCAYPVLPPANDECANATTLTCGSMLMDETTLGASGGLGTSCLGSQGDNVWYTFVGTGDNVTITVDATDPADGFEAQIDVYESTDGTCATATNAECLNGVGAGENPVEITFLSTLNTVYFIAVGNWINGDPGGVFDISLECTCPSPPVFTLAPDGNNCPADEFFVLVDVTSTGSATTVDISANGMATTHTGVGVGMYQIGPYPAGTAVNVVVADNGDADCNADADITTGACPPANDDCINAIVLNHTSSCSATDGTVEAGTDSGIPAPSCDGFTGTANDDVWYSFVANTTDPTITINRAFDAVIELFEGSCGSLTSIACDDTPSPETIQATGLTIGNTYYVRVFAYSSTTPTGDNALFDICVFGGTPANDLCTNAEDMTTEINGSGMIMGTTIDATTGTGAPDACTGPTPGAGVWFSFAFTNATPSQINLTCDAGSTIYVYQGGDCMNLTCAANATGQGTNDVTFNTNGSMPGFAGGPTHFVYVSGTSQDFTLNAMNTALPISLSHFSAEASGKVNLVEWTTSSELNVEAYSIERSFNGQTGWVEIGRVAANGTTNTTSEYSLVDETPKALSYYRLRSIDTNRSEQLSQVVVVERENEVDIAVYPVPANDMITVEFNGSANNEVIISITDITGKQLGYYTLTAADGLNKTDLSIADYADGIYFLTLDNGAAKVTQRIVKQ